MVVLAFCSSGTALACARCGRHHHGAPDDLHETDAGGQPGRTENDRERGIASYFIALEGKG